MNYRAQGRDVQPAEIIFLTWEFIELSTFTAADFCTELNSNNKLKHLNRYSAMLYLLLEICGELEQDPVT